LVDGPATTAVRTITFGPFRFLPEQQLLLEGETPVRLGSRALEVLAVLVEHPGEVVDKAKLIARVWPNISTDENTLRVHVAGLRRALGDGQPGRRYVANIPGRGYRFVAPVEFLEAQARPIPVERTPPQHNLPVMRSRILGRDGTIEALSKLLPGQRLVTIVGAGGIGKTTLAMAIAETLLPEFPDGACFVDLAPVEDPQFVSTTLASVLGIAVSPQNAIPRLVESLRDKRMLILLDNCERVVEAAAALTEQVLAGAAGVRILATSREPLRAEGERVHRLLPLEVPEDHAGLSAAEALAYPAVQLFVERAAAILDGFVLTDADASAVSAICGKLGGIALAIELAAARTDAFGIQQLELLLDDRFRVLNQGKRTAQPRHRSLAAALDWSYEFLPDSEQLVLRRLSVFAGDFTLEGAIAVAGGDETDVVQALANLVAKSLVSADVSQPTVQYRLLDTTRAYAMQKLVDSGAFGDCARRHALHQLDWFKSVEANWQERTNAEWQVEDGRRTEDLRSALEWAFSSSGDLSIAVSLTAAAIARYPVTAPIGEAVAYVERALASRTAGSTLTALEEARLLRVLSGALELTRGPRPVNRKLLTEALEIAERMDDLNGRVQGLLSLSVHCLHAGHYGEAAANAEACCAAGAASADMGHRLMGSGIAGFACYFLGDFAGAHRHIDSILNCDGSSQQYWFHGYKLGAQSAFAHLQWFRGLHGQAFQSIRDAVEQGEAAGSPIARLDTLAHSACWIALFTGHLEVAEHWITTLIDLSAKNALPIWNAYGRCYKGMLLLRRGDRNGLALLQDGLGWLREANFVFLRAVPTAALAQGLAAAGRTAEAHRVIDEALEEAESNEERWCVPEFLRVKGEIMRLDGPAASAEDCFLQALTEARRLEALSWELRIATSLARLWRDEGKSAAAHEVLSGVYGRFTEGFDTLDLRTARALIDELVAKPR